MDKTNYKHETTFVPGPSFEIDLAPLDALHPTVWVCRLLVFKCKSVEQRDAQLLAFKKGLQELVLLCPVLGGQIALANHGIEAKYDLLSGRGITLVVRDLYASIKPFTQLEKLNFCSSQLPYDLLMPTPDDVNAACKTQFSSIDGGTIISFAISHNIVDGVGTDEVMRMLSGFTRLAQQAPLEKRTALECETGTLGLDRSVLRNISSHGVFKIEDHPAYRITSQHGDVMESKSTTQVTSRDQSQEIPVLLRLCPDGLSQLKLDATTSGRSFISTHDALAALMWRSILYIRTQRNEAQGMRSSTTNFFMPSNARQHLNLPASYIGNAVYQLSASLDVSVLLSDSGLQQAAHAIRRAITNVNSDLVSSYMAELKTRWLDWGFLYDAATTTFGMGTDFSSTILYSLDWGDAFGPMVRYRFPWSAGSAGYCVLPKLPDGTAEAIVTVRPEEVALLRSEKLFGKYMEI
ncbi:hypothetical protein K461DRAFT_268730 [Myriangium duriaei CBS 260.36]|uniref:Uncharacterized protein n=1 Tax=Myriangium duriaei CBS 260.36 TaxID=1168546 RepID=A0A9P4J375_9PEZI|nr:hypothetical protein K461DRAFT_268730 [Myriangium duriaei CBS 260.36]